MSLLKRIHVDWWFTSLMLIGSALRVWDLGAARLWYDEVITAWMGHLPWASMVAATAGDTHPPLYLAIIWLWERIGGSGDAWIRIPSLLASIAALPVVWILADRLGLSRPGKIAALMLMVFSPFEIHFSQEARMYALLQLEVILLLWAVVDREWLAIGLANLAMLYTHNYGLFYFPVIFAFALAREMARPMIMCFDSPYQHLCPYKSMKDQANLKALFLAFLIPLALWIPWAVVLAGQIINISGGYWIQPVTPGSVVYTIYMLFWGFAMPEKLQPLSAVVNAGVLSYGVYMLIRKPGRYLGLAWLAIGPLALAVLVSLVKPVLLFRGLIGCSPILYIWIGSALAERKPVYKWVYSGAILLPLFAAGLWGYYTYNPDNKGDMTPIINQVREAIQPGETLYHINDGSAVLWEWYAPDLPQVEITTCPKEDLGSLSHQTRLAMGITQADYPGKGWVIWGDGPTSTSCEEIKAFSYTQGAELINLVRDDEFIHSGVWHQKGKN
jgi:uncharacterized membrane protein